MPDLGREIERFLEDLRRQNASEHTLRNYASDLEQLLCYFTIPGKPKPSVEEIDVLSNDAARQEMLSKSNGMRTVPQIFVGDTHVGGFDQLYALDKAGKLDPLLNS